LIEVGFELRLHGIKIKCQTTELETRVLIRTRRAAILTQYKAEVWDKNAMAELTVKHESGDSGQPGTGETASGVRQNVGNRMVVVRRPGGRRSTAGVELLRRLPVVNVGRKKRGRERDGEEVWRNEHITREPSMRSERMGEASSGRN
jgi:hypothetical protein